MYKGINETESFAVNIVRKAESVMEKYGKFLFETCTNENVEWALKVLTNREVVSEASGEYVAVPSDLVVGRILDKGVRIKSWKIDMYGAANLVDVSKEEKERCQYSGKFRIALVVETNSLFGEKRDLPW